MWEEEKCHMTERFLIACEGGAPDWVIPAMIWGWMAVIICLVCREHFKK